MREDLYRLREALPETSIRIVCPRDPMYGSLLTFGPDIKKKREQVESAQVVWEPQTPLYDGAGSWADGEER